MIPMSLSIQSASSLPQTTAQQLLPRTLKDSAVPTRPFQHSSRNKSVRQWRSARQAVTAASEKDKSWPRRSEPDALRQDFSRDTPNESGSGVLAARLDRFKETFFFRLATLGFGAVLVGERVSGGGFVQALGQPTGELQRDVGDVGIAFVVLCLFVGGLVPSRFIYETITEKPKTLFDDIPGLVGRASCLGLGATIATEAVTGKGILGLLNVQTGTDTLTTIEFAIVFVALFFVTNFQSLTADDSSDKK